MVKCTDCPRECGADREKSIGFCGASNKIRVSKVMLHRFEEPVISGDAGSGAIFFGGCNLRCVFCQNAPVSHGVAGEEWTEEQLERAIFGLVEKGAHNINLVTATHYTRYLAPLLERIKPRLPVPVVYNCGGYEKVESLRRLEGLVDIYLPDFKYYSPELSQKFSSAPDYPRIATAAIEEMCRQVPENIIENGLMKKGVIIRHLVLPAHRDDSKRVLELISGKFPSALVSIMRQYTPSFNKSEYPELNRTLTSFEYDEVVKYASGLGIDGFIQEKGCVSEKFTPDFTKIYQ